jgi:hypothetical protein
LGGVAAISTGTSGSVVHTEMALTDVLQLVHLNLRKLQFGPYLRKLWGGGAVGVLWLRAGHEMVLATLRIPRVVDVNFDGVVAVEIALEALLSALEPIGVLIIHLLVEVLLKDSFGGAYRVACDLPVWKGYSLSWVVLILVQIIVELLIQGLFRLLVEREDVDIKLGGLQSLSVSFYISPARPLVICLILCFRQGRVVLVGADLNVVAGGVPRDLVRDSVELMILRGRSHEVAGAFEARNVAVLDFLEFGVLNIVQLVEILVVLWDVFGDKPEILVFGIRRAPCEHL